MQNMLLQSIVIAGFANLTLHFNKFQLLQSFGKTVADCCKI